MQQFSHGITQPMHEDAGLSAIFRWFNQISFTKGFKGREFGPVLGEYGQRSAMPQAREKKLIGRNPIDQERRCKWRSLYGRRFGFMPLPVSVCKPLPPAVSSENAP